jgi:hypothetical protein
MEQVVRVLDCSSWPSPGQARSPPAEACWQLRCRPRPRTEAVTRWIANYYSYIFPFIKTCLVRNCASENLYNTVSNIDRKRTQPETPGTSFFFGSIRVRPLYFPPYSRRDYRSTSETWRTIDRLPRGESYCSLSYWDHGSLPLLRHNRQEFRTQSSNLKFSFNFKLMRTQTGIRIQWVLYSFA